LGWCRADSPTETLFYRILAVCQIRHVPLGNCGPPIARRPCLLAGLFKSHRLERHYPQNLLHCQINASAFA